MSWQRRRPKGERAGWLPKLNLRVKIDRVCTKARHATNEEAVSELAALLEHGGARLEDLNLYQCAICNGAWHVGHRVPSTERVPLRPPRRPRALPTDPD